MSLEQAIAYIADDDRRGHDEGGADSRGSSIRTSASARRASWKLPGIAPSAGKRTPERGSSIQSQEFGHEAGDVIDQSFRDIIGQDIWAMQHRVVSQCFN